jgi:hypothetical protein
MVEKKIAILADLVGVIGGSPARTIYGGVSRKEYKLIPCIGRRPQRDKDLILKKEMDLHQYPIHEPVGSVYRPC